MTLRRLDDEWQAWIDENLRRGCNPEELLRILLSSRFDVGAARAGMGRHFPAHSPLALAAEGRPPVAVDYAALADVRITRGDSGAVRDASDKLQLYTLERFLDADACAGLVAIIDRHLHLSTLTVTPANERYRTGRTSDLSLVAPVQAARLTEKIATTLGLAAACAEGLQAQRYDVGEEFKAHTDYFEPGTAEYTEHATLGGNRTWTFMVYLNDVEAGGATHFPAVDRAIAPVKGLAVAWNNLRRDGSVNPDTLHAGTPVRAGRKIIVTQWFRERTIRSLEAGPSGDAR